jgi:indolepyruvate ferredoxin oxidoreductase beta subunit
VYRVLEKSEEIMNYDIVLCGVGGQGGLSVSVVIARAAMAAGYRVKQSEVHGMSQRGGEVLANLRISSGEIPSPMIPKGKADLILAFEPLEALRYLPWLSRDNGILVSAMAPIKNIMDYPDIASVLDEIRRLPRHRLVDADKIAKESGNSKSINMVLLGAISDILPVPSDAIENAIAEIFGKKGEDIVESNIRAYRNGQTAR